MNYEKMNAAMTSPKGQDENTLNETLLACVLRRIDEAASTIYNNMNEVEGKLNFILGQEPIQGKDNSEGVKPIEDSDFAQRVFSALSFLETQAGRLEAARHKMNRIY